MTNDGYVEGQGLLRRRGESNWSDSLSPEELFVIQLRQLESERSAAYSEDLAAALEREEQRKHLLQDAVVEFEVADRSPPESAFGNLFNSLLRRMCVQATQHLALVEAERRRMKRACHKWRIVSQWCAF